MALRHNSLNTVGPQSRGPSIFAQAGDEPALAELLADPVLHALLASDRLASLDLERGSAEISLARRRLTPGTPPT